MDYEEMRAALADYLGLDLDEVVYNPDSEDYGYGYGTEFFTPEGTYRVYDEDEATQGVKDDIENLVDDTHPYKFAQNSHHLDRFSLSTLERAY